MSKAKNRDYYCESQIGKFPNQHQCGEEKGHKGEHKCYDKNCDVTW